VAVVSAGDLASLKRMAVMSAGDLADAGESVTYKGVLIEACGCNECR